jgi:chemotaxis protein MotB
MAESSESKRPAATSGPVSGPVSLSGHEFFLVDSRPIKQPVFPDKEKVKTAPKPKWQELAGDDPYVYSGAVKSPRPWGAVATGVACVLGLGAYISASVERANVEDQLKKTQTELAAATTTTTTQAQQLATFETARKAQIAELVAKDQEEQQAKAKVIALRDAMMAATPAETGAGDIAFTPDGRALRVELKDKLLFESDGVTLTDAGREALVRLAGALKDGDAATTRIDVIGHVDPRRKPAKNADALEDGAWGLGAARATLVLRALEDDAKIAGKRLSAVSRGSTQPLAGNGAAKGRAKNRRVELVISPAA